MSKKNNTIFKLWSKVFFFTLLLVFIIQLFFVQSYTVSSSQMENVLHRGDRILVNKLAYGLRLPVTPLSIPFTFDHLFGMKSYFSRPSLGYHRLFSSGVNTNDIVLFNNPSELEKPLDKRGLVLSRCIAVGGDTISFKNNRFFVNGIEYVTSPDVVYPFKLKKTLSNSFSDLVTKYNLKVIDQHSDSIWNYFSLSKYEAFLLNQDLGDSLILNIENLPAYPFDIIIPYKGLRVKLDSSNIMYYANAILDEYKDSVPDLNNIDSYQFKNDYYWFLSDNMQTGIDSRSFGIVSDQHIIGKPFFTWYKGSK